MNGGSQLVGAQSLVRVEAYGPGGAAIMMEFATRQRAETVARVRQVLYRNGGALGAPDSVSYLFNPVGRLVFAPRKEAARLVRVAFEAGAEDVVRNVDGSIEVLTDPIEFESIRSALRESGFEAESALVTRRAAASVVLENEAATRMVRLLRELKTLDHLQNVYTNAEISDAVLAQF
jgi:transcriptional/translational regulatory protein YebC/TACO1